MGAGPNLAEAAQATAFTENVAERWWSEFQERLCGIYRIGTLAHGGFSARYSDIDWRWSPMTRSPPPSAGPETGRRQA